MKILRQHFQMASLHPTSRALPNFPRNSTLPLFSSTTHIFSSPFHLHRSSLRFPSNTNTRHGRCLAASPGPPQPQPPESDPRFKKDSASSTGLAATFSRFQDTLQIFFAVLFWLSLFFWTCGWDGRNNGRPNKGSRFRR